MERTNNFDGLRLIAAMAVLLSHMAALGGEQEWRPVHGMTWGLLGVFVFFSISGYLVIKSWRSDPNIGRFLERRFLRIAPGLAVVVPVSFLLVKALGLHGFPDNPFHAINGSLWTIEYEVMCYFIMLGLALLTPYPALVACLIVVLGTWMDVGGYLLYFAPFFALGMVYASYPAIRKWSWAIIGLGIATLPDQKLALALIVTPLAIEVGTRSWPILRSLGRHGDLSYGVYIYAFPVQQIVVAYMGIDATYWSLLAVCLPIVLGLAWLSWRYVESPALARKPAKKGASYSGMAQQVA